MRILRARSTAKDEPMALRMARRNFHYPLRAPVREPEPDPCTASASNTVPLNLGITRLRPHGGIDHRRNACLSTMPQNSPPSASE